MSERNMQESNQIAQTPIDHGLPSVEPGSPLVRLIQHFLERSITVLYVTIGFCFLIGVVLELLYTIWDIWFSLPAILNNTIVSELTAGQLLVTFTSNLLFALVILAILGTVIQYLKFHTTSIRSFLTIGLIAAIRGILSVGVRLAVERGDLDLFTRNMIELSVNAGVVLVLGITLAILRRGPDHA